MGKNQIPDKKPRESADISVKEKTKTKKPSMYKVLMMNDDFTPMDFVVVALKKFFKKPHEDAIRIMTAVHNTGIGMCGIYTYEVAETKVAQVMTFARQHQHPLKCVLEKE